MRFICLHQDQNFIIKLKFLHFLYHNLYKIILHKMKKSSFVNTANSVWLSFQYTFFAAISIFAIN